MQRIEMSPSFNGVSDDVFAKKSVCNCQASPGFSSTLKMHRLMEVRVCGGVTESTRIRPREGSSGSKATFDGIS